MSVRKPALLLLSAAALLAAGCTPGPVYKRPAVNAPQAYRAPAAVNATPANAPANAASLGAEQWASVFQDPVLKGLIQEAIHNNYDIRIAAQRILEAQDQLGITRSQQFPAINGSAIYEPTSSFGGSGNSGGTAGTSSSSGSSSKTHYIGGLALTGSWNLDFWGYYRQQTVAARNELLATRWAQRVTLNTVIEEVATAYFQLRTLDAELAITRNTVKARRQYLQLTQTLERGGAGTLEDVRLAQESLYQAEAQIPDLQRQIAQQENALSILLGRNPGPIARPGLSVVDWPAPKTVPAGIPSQLLERRPDIQEAEAILRADNANVRVARAALFPHISLSATGGTVSSKLKQLFDASNFGWYASGALAQTVFDAGRLRANIHLTEAQKQAAVLSYQQTIKQAFAGVSDALIALQRYREYRVQEQRVAFAAKDATRLSLMRYQSGAASYLEVLTNETTYYTAQLNLAAARRQEAISFVQLYNALGGGWQ
ncbi:MAG: efflux transporter outer membrane subunit [Acidobacteriaceae bacterium]